MFLEILVVDRDLFPLLYDNVARSAIIVLLPFLSHARSRIVGFMMSGIHHLATRAQQGSCSLQWNEVVCRLTVAD